MLYSLSYAACSIDGAGVVTGAACTIPKTTQEKTTKAIPKKEQTKPKSNKQKNKKINFKLDRSLLYRNVTIIWFN